MSEQGSENGRRTTSLVGHVVRRGIPIGVLMALMAGAYVYWRNLDGAPAHIAAPMPQKPLPVNATTIQRETVPIRMRFLGQTEAAQLVEIRARVAGYLQERSFTEGEVVEEGQKLFQIDPRPFEVEVAKAKAGLASAEATLARAGQQLERFQRLTTRGAVAVQEMEDWQTQRQVAAAQVQQQQALIAAAELQLQYASVKSPITGLIGQALKDSGSYVDAGPNGLLAIVQQVDPIYVRYAVTEQEILKFRRQQTANEIAAPEVDQLELEITLSDGSTYPARGRINFVDVQVDESTGTSVIRGEVPNPDGALKPGQFIYASVLGVQRVDVVRVPQGAVLQSPAGPSVLVINEESIAEARPIVLGEWSGNEHWIVEQGLKPGERVITDRLMMVRPGVPVTHAVAGVRAPSTADGQPAMATSAAPAEGVQP